MNQNDIGWSKKKNAVLTALNTFWLSESTNCSNNFCKIGAQSANFLRKTGCGTRLMPMLNKETAATISCSCVVACNVSNKAKKYSVDDWVPLRSLIISVMAANMANISLCNSDDCLNLFKNLKWQNDASNNVIEWWRGCYREIAVHTCWMTHCCMHCNSMQTFETFWMCRIVTQTHFPRQNWTISNS